MKQFIMVLVFMLFSQLAFAGVTINTDGLSEVQKAELVQQIETIKTNNKSPEAVIQSLDKWVNIGERFGKMLGSAAKELGMAANEFLKTPAGLMTASVILYNYIGNSLIHVGFGSLMFIVGITFLIKTYKRLSPIVVTYDPEKTDIFGRNRKLETKTKAMSTEELIVLFFGYLVVCLVSGLVTLN